MNTLEDFLLKAITYGLFSPSSFFNMIPLCFPFGVKQCRLFGQMYSLYCGKDKILYCCEADNDKFYGIKQDGTILFSFSSGDFIVPICDGV
jgi:hypothetical protein